MFKTNLCLAFILGLFLSGYLLFSPNILLFVLIFILFLIIPIFFKKYRYCFLAFVLILGAFYQSYYEEYKKEQAFKYINSKPRAIVGTITGNVSKYNDVSYFYMNLDSGIKAYVKFRGNEALYPGFILEIEDTDITSTNIKNKISPNNMKLLGNNAFLSIIAEGEKAKIRGFNKWYYLQYYGKILRENCAVILEKYLDKEQASICNAMLSSEKDNIPEDLYEELIITGTIHIIVVSGMHFTLLFGILFIFFSLFSKNRRLKLIFILPILIFYVFFTGSTLPVLRAFLMTSIFLFSDLFYIKKMDNKNLVLAVAVLFLGLTPTLIYNPSFLLTFGAVLGIVLYYSYFESKLGFVFSYLRDYLSAFFSAQIFTYPIIHYFFGRISTIAILSNLLVAPTVGLIIVLSIILIIFSYISFNLATIVAFVLNLIAKYFIIAVRYTSYLNFESLNFDINIITVILLFSIGIAIYYFLILKDKKYKVFLAVISFILFFMVTASIWVFPNFFTNKLIVTFIGAKNTNSAIIKAPKNNYILYGSLEDIYYNIKGSQVKKNAKIPLVILDDISKFEFLYELISLYKFDNIVMPSKYKANYPDLQNIAYITTNTKTQFDHLDIKISANNFNFKEVSFEFYNSTISFSKDNEYIENNLLNSSENKTVIINSKYKNKYFEEISNSNILGNNQIYSKKYYNDKIKTYSNFSIIEVTEKGINFEE
jgi:ComEC/Rec2-related protein